MALSDLFRGKKQRERITQLEQDLERVIQHNLELGERIQALIHLEKYQGILDIDAYVENAKAEAETILNAAQKQADAVLDEAQHLMTTMLADSQAEKKAVLDSAKMQAESLFQDSYKIIAEANKKASAIMEEAQQKAHELAGEALTAQQNYEENKKLSEALRNIIEGYGDTYIIPTYSLLDDLAEEFGYDEAGLMLKQARDLSKAMIRQKDAAACDYVENNRKEIAIRFVIDAFNGKADSILSRTKNDNYGKQRQAIMDAFTLVNANGKAFRNARITTEYLNARLDELKWACTAQELKKRQQEEQRELRERMREEERARKEFEKAQRDAAKEEEYYRKAMIKAREAMASASAEMKSSYEAKLADFEQKLKQAEEKNQRALSMAQQTRAGNVYIISNIGSFEEDVFKVGMTRRLNPEDRVRELGDASVPFPFDIHGIVYSTDAPTLEKELHHALLSAQMNKANPRKEFFKASLAQIKTLVESKGYNAHWSMAAEAFEYRETLKIEQQIASNPAVRAEWEGAMTKAVDDAVDVEDEIA